MTRIKICGITCKEDLKMVVSAGVDAVGFVFAESPRQVVPSQVEKWVEVLPPAVLAVGVFVDAHKNRFLLERCLPFLDAVQLHGEEPPEFCQYLAETCPAVKIIKALRIANRESLSQSTHWEPYISALLLDTFVKEKRGGTGEAFDWGILVGWKFSRPVILAGGLCPENVQTAVLKARPYGVDVSSGVEAFPGRKDPQKVARFVQAVRQADALLESTHSCSWE